MDSMISLQGKIDIFYNIPSEIANLDATKINSGHRYGFDSMNESGLLDKQCTDERYHQDFKQIAESSSKNEDLASNLNNKSDQD